MPRELRSAWLPNLTDAGLDRLIEMLEKGSPFLIHGCFTKSAPMGCLASHAAWHHPRTAHLTQDAGITWLHHVAGLNPATSHVLREWDGRGANDLDLRAELLNRFRDERQAHAPRRPRPPRTARRFRPASEDEPAMLPRVLEPEVMDSAEEARDYDAMDHSAVNRVFVADFLAVWDGRNPVLDVGAGTAQIPIELCRQSADGHVVAVDLAEQMLAVGRDNVCRAGLSDRIRLERCDAKRLPSPPAPSGR